MNQAITEKIKALLRLARSANRHEAELALQRAFELAQKHRIDVTALDPDAESIGHEKFPHGQRTSFLQARCLGLLQRFFHVDVCVGFGDVTFVGTPTDVTIAHYVYGFLGQQGRRWLLDFERAEKAARRKVTATKKENFVQGFIYGISQQLNQAKPAALSSPSGVELAVAEGAQRKRHLEQLFPHTRQISRKVERRHETAMMSGWIKGQETQINQPLNGGRETLALA